MPYKSNEKWNLFLFLRYLNFYPDFFGHVGKRLDEKAKINLKFVMSQSEKQTITIHILPNSSRGKDNQTMKFI